ncbi:DUF1302 domain-containing protein [Kangiella sediminilitoris]|uniref:DUF1302 domain-containing protein n=1 Tax=Kangiella sediminilitoris TaxID=1144748 RepID=A0A1B3B925_9GAMM|nr:DUF1302 domain-containing protein [Kangiella sediminilitoris]AOE49307.1 hypothetical protein KS2013_583 [Kangiella sediminilitoris]
MKRNKPIMTLSKIAAGVSMAFAASASNAVSWDSENFEYSFDTTLSVGASMRVEERDRGLVGKANLYQLETGMPITTLYGSGVVPDGAWSNNSDDGNLNFNKGDFFSQVAKGTHELDIRHKDGDYGLFARGLWYYDRVLMDKELRFRDLDTYPEGAYAAGETTARKEQGYDARMLDVYAWSTWDLSDYSIMQVRLGEQVVSWGESTFIQHSLSEANAVDLRTLRNPGAELKEAFIPSSMLWASAEWISDSGSSLTLEGFYQFEWEPVRTDEPGTYFATRDFLGLKGSEVHLGFAQFPEGQPGTVAIRSETRPADDDGQYGMKVGYFTEMGTEWGFYYMNYHNRRPIISANAADQTGTVYGFLEYPEDIQMLGISMNTATDSGISVAGEVSYRIDEPLQVDDVELLFATLEPIGQVPSGTSQVANGVGLGEEISGYRLHDTIQAQMTFTNLLGPVFGSDQTALLLEVGMNQILDMPDKSELRYEAEGTFRSGNPDRAVDANGNGRVGGVFELAPPGSTPCGFTNPATGDRVTTECEGMSSGFADEFSWGYRLAMRWDYNDVFSGWNMKPRIVFQHDVKGNTPAPISNFLEDRKSIALGTSFDYQARWKVDFAYNVFMGAEDRNLISDRDYVSLALSYSF